MIIKDLVKEATLKLSSLYESCQKEPLVELTSLEETVTHLSQQVQDIDLASDQILKTDLNTLQSALLKLGSMLSTQQETLARQVEEIHLHQLALHAYARVANHNLGSIA
jgi:cob(I)alamin adenosyltransferase